MSRPQPSTRPLLLSSIRGNSSITGPRVSCSHTLAGKPDELGLSQVHIYPRHTPTQPRNNLGNQQRWAAHNRKKCPGTLLIPLLVKTETRPSVSPLLLTVVHCILSIFRLLQSTRPKTFQSTTSRRADQFEPPTNLLPLHYFVGQTCFPCLSLSISLALAGSGSRMIHSDSSTLASSTKSVL